jgi:hypothetical protein
MDSFLWYGPKALTAMISYEKSIMKISRDKFNNKIMAKDAIKAYFKEILNQYQINGVKELSNYPDQKLIELKDINR